MIHVQESMYILCVFCNTVIFYKKVIDIFTYLGPGTKREKPSEVKDVVSIEEESRPEGSQLNPLRKPLPRSPAISTSFVKG